MCRAQLGTVVWNNNNNNNDNNTSNNNNRHNNNRHNTDNDIQFGYAGQLNSLTHLSVLLVLHDRGIFVPGN
jgi:hypothetical protein